MNLIIKDPTEKAFEQARAIASLKHNSTVPVNTDISKRISERRRLEKALLPSDICTRQFIPWDKIAQTLSGLNSTITYTSLPDAKVAIGLATPSKKEIRDWETAPLSPSDREEIKAWGNHQGPRPFLVAASRGYVAPYTRIVTKSHPTQIVCRSLRSICQRLIEHRAFTWNQAEIAFGFRFRGPGTQERTEFINATPQEWADRRPQMTVVD